MQFIKRLGPGLLYAGAAVGVSHIYQSTSAGAQYGWIMLIAVILSNILKYPFFEYGPRYAAATGTSLLHGYKSLGNWALWLFLVLTIATMFIIQAAVTIVTAGLAVRLFGINCPPDQIWIVAACLILICVVILQFGRYALLSKLMRVVMIVLAITTVAAFILSFWSDVHRSDTPGFHLDETTLLFIVSFVGWMPAPMDISVWHSVWSVSSRQGKGKDTIQRALFDFKVGYWGTVVLAMLFVGLGTLMIFGTGRTMPGQAGAFASELIDIYADSLGDWSKPFIALAAFTTMFSTTITCFDAFPRVLSPTITLIGNKEKEPSKNGYLFWLILVGIGAVIILKFFTKSMADLILFITVTSFLAAPIIALLNHLAVHRNLEASEKPSNFLRWLGYIGMLTMLALSVYYLFSRLI